MHILLITSESLDLNMILTVNFNISITFYLMLIL